MQQLSIVYQHQKNYEKLWLTNWPVNMFLMKDKI